MFFHVKYNDISNSQNACEGICDIRRVLLSVIQPSEGLYETLVKMIR